MSLTVKMPNCMSSPLLVESATISPWSTRPAPGLCPAERASRARGIPVRTPGPPSTFRSCFATCRRTTPTRPGRAGNGAVAAGPAGESGLALSGRGSGFRDSGFRDSGFRAQASSPGTAASGDATAAGSGGRIRMLRHTDTVPVKGGGTAGDPGGSSSASRPKVTGDLDDLLSQASFHLRWRGYDRLEVENYVSWAESELLAARRQADHLLSRYGAASAELELSRRLLAQAPKGDRDLSSVSERVTEILR